MNEAEYEAAGLVETWAEATLRQLQRYRAAWERQRTAWKQFDLGVDGAPDQETRSRLFRELWSESHMLVWAAHQLELWLARWAKERGEQPPPVDEYLKVIRNVLEHLNEAEFRHGRAVPGREAEDPAKLGKWNKPKWSGLIKLPGMYLSTAITDDGQLFDLLQPERLEQMASAALSRINSEQLDRAGDHWFDLREE
ncbi:hypothetical protein [Amycolatopsis thermoflava]|uniref:hypothetical protein n=1 Tax=Amycolatopsis thermoflava TaxID=84480 RepID=UPI0003F61A80|nr:hypothetical protein [Amycolatopsis thermoflava]